MKNGHWVYRIILALGAWAAFASSVTTANYDQRRTGANTAEAALTHAAVAAKFGKLCSYSVDGAVYAQPLVIEGVTAGGMTRTLVIVATMHNTVYAFDASGCGAPVWSRNLGAPLTSFPGGTGADLYNDEQGVLGTPVIDAASKALYLVNVASDGKYFLNAVSLTDGSDAVTPAEVTAIVGMRAFNPARHLQRAGLALANNRVYVAFCGREDQEPYEGWMMAYNKATLAQEAAMALAPASGSGSGIWMTSGAPAVDSNGNLIIMTGNNRAAEADGQKFMKLSANLEILGFFRPANWAELDAVDRDLGSSRPVLIEDQAFVIGGGKDGKMHVLDASDMSEEQEWTTVAGQARKLYAGIVFANNTLFYAPGEFGSTFERIYRYAWNGSSFHTTATHQTAADFAFPGATLAYSSNGSTAGTDIVWAVTCAVSASSTARAGTLRAFKGSDLTELWSSAAAADILGAMSKFSIPTVANGKVYVPTLSDAVVVYALLPPARAIGTVMLSGGASIQ